MNENIRYTDLLGYMNERRDLLISMLRRIVRVPSVRSEPEEHAPFGKACAQALAEAGRLYAENGFETDLHADSGYLLSYFGGGDKTIGVFSHADVVPVDDKWTMSEPFSGDVIDGFMFGRGSSDNKCSVIATILAASAIRDLCHGFSSRILMFTGANEESGMADLGNYIREQPMPDISLVPDSGFPIFRGEKGIMRFYARAKEPFDRITDFSGGEAVNIILGQVKAKINVSTDGFDTGFIGDDSRFSVDLSDGVTVTANGISKHAAAPDGSLNAAFLMAEKLSECPALTGRDRKTLSDIASLKGDYGEGFGIKNDDPDFGPLTIANGIARMKDGRLSLSFDIRYGSSIDSEVMTETIRKRLDSIGFDFELMHDRRGYVIPKDNPNLQLLMKTYSECTGFPDDVCCVNGGGTYAKYLKNAFTMGASTDKKQPFTLPPGHGLCHQPDECVPIDGVAEAAAILAYMLIKLDKEGMIA